MWKNCVVSCVCLLTTCLSVCLSVSLFFNPTIVCVLRPQDYCLLHQCCPLVGQFEYTQDRTNGQTALAWTDTVLMLYLVEIDVVSRNNA